MRTYAGIDLHSSNCYLGIIDEQLEKVFGKRLNNSLLHIIECLKPYKDKIEGIVVESTYNWYWLVDGLQEQSYTVHLANPSAIKQYEGIKYSDDKWDALWLAHLLKLGILPQGYIYPKETRPLRDMLRRRMLFVRQRTADILSFQSMISRNTGKRMSASNIRKMNGENLGQLFSDPDLIFMAQRYLSIIDSFSQQIKMIEKQAMENVRLTEPFKWLSTITGVGKILAMVIMLEVGDINRFKKVGNYCSYCRCVKSERLSNGKKKGAGNTKNGNKYLSWAYVEAANFCIRHNPQAERFYQRKKAKSNGIVAIKALSNKLARASYYMMRDQVPFDSHMLFA